MSRKARFVFIVAAIAVLVLAIPASAHAATKYATRLKGMAGLQNQYVVDRTVSGSAVATPVAQFKLQRYYQGAWRYVSGFVRVYRTTSDGKMTYLPAYSKTYSSNATITVPLAIRGEYKVYYMATTYNKSTTRYVVRYDDIVSNVGTPTVLTAIEGANTTFTVSQDVTWNSVDYPGLKASLYNDLRYYTYDEMTDEEESVSYSWNRTVSAPGVYTHIWNAGTSEWQSLADHIWSSYLTFDNDQFIWPEETFLDTYGEDI